MPTLSTLVVRLTGDTTGFAAAMGAAERESATVASRMGGAFASIAKGAIGVAVGGVAALAGGLVVAGKTGLGFNNELEQVTAQLNSFTKDGKKSAEILDMIRARAAKTPFAFNEMAKATAGLMPVAKQTGGKLEDLVGIAEILAASNPAQGLEGAAFALREAASGDFASIIERFNLPRQEINKLKEQGVPALESVRKVMQGMGLDASLVTNMGNTLSGRWSTFLDSVTGVAAKVTKPLFERLSAGLGDVNGWLESNGPLLDGFADQLTAGVSSAINFVIDGVGTLADIWGDVKDGFDEGGLAGAIGNGGARIADMLGLDGNAIGDALFNAVSWLQVNLPIALQTASTVWSTTLQPALASAATWLSINIPAAVATASSVWTSTLQPALVNIASVWNTTVQPALALAVAWLQVNLPAAISAAAGFWTSTLQPALANIGAWLGVAIPAAIAIASAAWTNVIQPAIVAVATAITTYLLPRFMASYQFLTVDMPAAIGVFIEWWSGTLMPALEGVWNWISINLVPLFNSLSNLLSVVVGKSVEALAWLWRNELQPALKSAWKFIQENILPIFVKVGGTLDDAVGPSVNKFVTGALQSLRDGLTWLEGLISRVKNLFDGFAKIVAGFTLPPDLKRHSPSPMELTFMNTAQYLRDIKRTGMPDFGGVAVPNALQPFNRDVFGGAQTGDFAQFGAGNSGSNGGVTQNITIGRIDDGLDAFEVARTIGREVRRRQ